MFIVFRVQSKLEKLRRKPEAIKSAITDFKKKQLEIPELKNTTKILRI